MVILLISLCETPFVNIRTNSEIIVFKRKIIFSNNEKRKSPVKIFSSFFLFKDQYFFLKVFIVKVFKAIQKKFPEGNLIY